MTNQERAEEIMRRWMPQAPDVWDECARQAVAELGNAGLLMPDLPEPEKAYDDPAWDTEHRQWCEENFGEHCATPSVWKYPTAENQSIAVFPSEKDGQVCPYYDGEPEEPVDAQTARRIGLAWLAAANLAEKSTNA
ncbi:hypothetical protein [Corynebacterium callunae]|uniref:hypothetical protein n=1 Tax=Corynebacterium callunae TaxID=1721 RepID=UPI0020004316|nr:hypothetical protein [Corynebacterium callunae]MCK2200498.1 hypothetical protein [Corynebacterium callunae]